MKLKLKRGEKSPFSCTNKQERGSLLIEVLVIMGLLSYMFTLLVSSYGSTTPIRETLELSQDFQIREYTKLYNMIAPQVAQTLNIGDSVVFQIDSPNFLTYDGTKYINLFEDYTITDDEWTREGFVEPLVIYNTLKNKVDFTVTRSGINTYAGLIKFYYQDYKDLRQFKYELNTSRITVPQDLDFAVSSRGIQMEYEVTISGEIVTQKLKN